MTVGFGPWCTYFMRIGGYDLVGIGLIIMFILTLVTVLMIGFRMIL